MNDSEIKQLIEDTEKERSRLFLKSWKVAVKNLGAELFNIQAATIDAATDRRELRPDMEAIKKRVHKKENELHFFLFMVISFYSFVEIEQIFISAGHGFPRIIDLQLLDETERMIIYALVEYSDVDDEW